MKLIPTNIFSKTCILLFLLLFNFLPSATHAYSVLTHEAIIDASWETHILPLLKNKFPNATPEQLKKAHTYVYGGAIFPDIGYYPFGSKFFTYMVHYVRTGDFTEELLHQAQDLNEYAFAIGMMCHYFADNYGHPLGTNQCEPLLFPKVKKKYGDNVTYEQKPSAHIRTEFSFDVLQIMRGGYFKENYYDFINFDVPKPLIQRAFLKVYGLELDEIFPNWSKAVGTFRWSVKDLFPVLTKAAWVNKRTYLSQLNPSIKSQDYIFKMKRNQYNKDFGKQRVKAGPLAITVAFIIRVLPKIGPLKVLKFSAPAKEAQDKYAASFDSVVTHYTRALNSLKSGKIELRNLNYDTGKKITPGEYEMVDESYSLLLTKLYEYNFNCLTPTLKKQMITFYNNKDVLKTDKKSKQWRKTILAFEKLKQTNSTTLTSE